MKGKYAILWMLLLIGFCACADKKSITDALQHAEALMDEHPDSALQLLHTLSADEMNEKRNRAWYALLYTQAKHKCYIDETNDSLISIAVDYYRSTDDIRRRFLSYYYKGRILANGENYLKATSCYMEAEQLADAVNDGYLQGLLYAEMGRIYRLCYDYSKSLEAYQKAAECYECAGKIRHRNYMWLNQSLNYRNLNQYVTSEQILHQVLTTAKENQDLVLVNSCLGDLVLLYIEQSKMEQALKCYEELKQQKVINVPSAYLLSKVAELYVSEGKLEEAKACIEQGWEQATNQLDSVNLFISSSHILSAIGNEKEAYQKLQEGMSLQVKEAHQALSQPVLTAQRDFLEEKLELEAYQLRLEKRYKFLSILFLLMLLAVTAYVFILIFKRYKKKSQQTIRFLENEKTKAEIRIASLLTQLDRDKKEADETIAKLMEEIHLNEENSHAKITRLKQRLEQRKKSMAESISHLHTELEILQNNNRKMTVQKAELLKNDLEHIIELVLLHKEHWYKDDYKINRINEKIALLKLYYFAGDTEYKKVEQLVNLHLDNVMKHFREEVSLPLEADYRRACYMFVGISASYIAEIMGESKDVVYQRRSRLLKKLASLSCDHKEMFTLLLSK